MSSRNVFCLTRGVFFVTLVYVFVIIADDKRSQTAPMRDFEVKQFFVAELTHCFMHPSSDKCPLFFITKRIVFRLIKGLFSCTSNNSSLPRH